MKPWHIAIIVLIVITLGVFWLNSHSTEGYHNNGYWSYYNPFNYYDRYYRNPYYQSQYYNPYNSYDDNRFNSNYYDRNLTFAQSNYPSTSYNYPYRYGLRYI